MGKKKQVESSGGVWKPSHSFFVQFKDQTADDRTSAQLDEMVQKMEGVAEQYGFKVQRYGGQRALIRYSLKDLLSIVECQEMFDDKDLEDPE